MGTLSKNEISFENNFEGNFMNRSTYRMASPQWLPKRKYEIAYLSNDCIAQKNRSYVIPRAVVTSNSLLFISITATAVLREQRVVHSSQRLSKL